MVKVEAGQSYGKWAVLQTYVDGPTPRKRETWAKVRCECGSEYDVRASTLSGGRSTQCRICKARQNAAKTPQTRGETSLPSGVRSLYRTYFKEAEKHDREFSLTPDEFHSIIASCCYYCGIEPSNNHRGMVTYSGIDRRDNSLGYTKENAVPCCMDCNFAKRGMTEDQFLSWVARIAKYRSLT